MAAQSQVLPTSDLRSSAKETRRDIDHKTKWARGGYHAPGKTCPHGNVEECTCHDRPLPKPKNNWRHVVRSYDQKGSNKTSWAQKAALRRDLNAADLYTGPSDSSADEEVRDASAAPMPMSDGTHVLGLAVTKAIERFENKETEKLAKEYEFVPGKENDADGDYFADDDDFEIIHAEGF